MYLLYQSANLHGIRLFENIIFGLFLYGPFRTYYCSLLKNDSSLSLFQKVSLIISIRLFFFHNLHCFEIGSFRTANFRTSYFSFSYILHWSAKKMVFQLHFGSSSKSFASLTNGSVGCRHYKSRSELFLSLRSYQTTLHEHCPISLDFLRSFPHLSLTSIRYRSMQHRSIGDNVLMLF